MIQVFYELEGHDPNMRRAKAVIIIIRYRSNVGGRSYIINNRPMLCRMYCRYIYVCIEIEKCSHQTTPQHCRDDFN